MRVLVFAHIPPPFHGQSYMVRLMLENLGNATPGAGPDIVLHHVNAQLSDGIDDIGVWRIGKFFRLLGYIFQAWWLRWKYSPDAFYYVPAPPAKRGALYRDWLVLLLAAPVFKIRIFHWHAVGLGQWVREGASAGRARRVESWITRRLYDRHDLSCVLNDWSRRDIEIFSPRHITIVPNGIPDTCPDFETELLPQRTVRARERFLHRAESPGYFQLLYLAHATQTKGLFDTLDAVALANARLHQNLSGWRIRLTIAGAFLDEDERRAFRMRVARGDLLLARQTPAVLYAGQVESAEKEKLLRESDALCFASYYPNEGQPVSVIEALSHGLPVLLSRWRALPEMISPGLAHLVDPSDPAALATALVSLADETRFAEYRKHYLDHFSLAAHLESLRAAFLSVATGPEKP